MNDLQFLDELEAKATAAHFKDNRIDLDKPTNDRLLLLLGEEPGQFEWELCSYEAHRILAYVIRARRLTAERVRTRILNPDFGVNDDQEEVGATTTRS